MAENLILSEEAVEQIKKGMPILEGKICRRGNLASFQGNWVRLCDKNNHLLALGLVDKDKRFICRVMPFQGREPTVLDDEFFKEPINSAKSLRQKLFRGSSKTDVYRLLNAEGDGIPGLVLDRYGDYGVSWLVTPGLKAISAAVYQAAIKIYGLKGIYEKGPPLEGFHPEQDAVDRPVIGEPAPDTLYVREGDLILEARLNEGPRTGIYPDQRENRRLLASLVRDNRVLNTFSYTGAFSVSAAFAGAKGTVSVDLSRRALEWSKRNFRLNGLDLTDHLHVKADVFDYLSLAQKKRFYFELIILDPPPFSTSRAGIFKAQKDWPRLLSSALKILEKGGWLALSCNMTQLTEEDLLCFVERVGREEGREVEIQEIRGLPRDFPTHPLLPQMRYLKFILARFF